MTTTTSNETLMAFADGELDPAQRAHIEAALEMDADLRQRVAALRLQRARVATAFDTVLAEPVPDRLSQLQRTGPATPVVPSVAPPAAAVIHLADVRAERARLRNMPSWAQWGGMAASVLLGLWLGAQMGSGNGAGSELAMNQGPLVAGGSIAKALSGQLASEPLPGASVAVQLSFVDKDGSYCRTFSTARVAGLACQQQRQWTVQQVAAVQAPAGGEVRQAASALPPAILDAVDQRIAGGTLDAAAEKLARDHAWRR